MTATRERASTESVHAALRADVLAGVHAPGERLKFATLCRRYEASVSVVREALTRLAAQGLVEAVPRIGFRVRSVSVTDLQKLTTARIDIESLTLRHAIDVGGLEWESDLVAAHHRLERTPLLTDDDLPRVSDTWEDAHRAFHAVLLTGCENPWLLDTAQTLRDASEFYRRWSQTKEPTRDVPAEHRAILEATLARDSEAAVKRLQNHIQHTTDIVTSALQERRA